MSIEFHPNQRCCIYCLEMVSRPKLFSSALKSFCKLKPAISCSSSQLCLVRKPWLLLTLISSLAELLSQPGPGSVGNKHFKNRAAEPKGGEVSIKPGQEYWFRLCYLRTNERAVSNWWDQSEPSRDWERKNLDWVHWPLWLLHYTADISRGSVPCPPHSRTLSSLLYQYLFVGFTKSKDDEQFFTTCFFFVFLLAAFII